MPAAERRVDPSDGRAYTFNEITAFYRNVYPPAEIKVYWDVACRPAAAGKAKAKPAPGSAGAAPSAKADAKPAAKQRGKKGEAAPGNSSAAAKPAAKQSPSKTKTKGKPSPAPPGPAPGGPLLGNGGASAAEDGGADAAGVRKSACCSQGIWKILLEAVRGKPASQS